MSDEAVRRRWSRSDADYYKELEAFHEKHADARSIVYDNETKCPVRAEYYFTPFQVYIEDLARQMELAKISARNTDET